MKIVIRTRHDKMRAMHEIANAELGLIVIMTPLNIVPAPKRARLMSAVRRTVKETQ